MNKAFLFCISLMFCVSGFSKPEYSTGIFHIGLVVENMEKSIDFYQNVLGMKRVAKYSADGEKASDLGLTDGKAFEAIVFRAIDVPEATELKLITFDGIKSQHPNQTWIHDDVGVQYLTLLVNSLKPFLERIQERGLTMLGATPSPVNESNHLIMLQDPDGNFIEVIGPME